LSIFTEEFQVKVLCLLAKNKLLGVDSYFRSEYFFVDSLVWSYSTIIGLRKRFPQIGEVSADMLSNEANFNQKLVEWTDKSKEYFADLIALLDGSKPFEDQSYVGETVIQFIRKRELSFVLNKSSEFIEQGDWESLKTSLQSNTPVVQNTLIEEDELFSENSFSFLGRAERLTTDFIPIDVYLGGLTKGELLLLLADTNVGKSLFMTWLGGRLVRKGSRVLHVTLEMSKELTNDRYFVSILDDADDFSWADYESAKVSDDTLVRFVGLRKKYADRYKGMLKIYKGKNLGFSLADVSFLMSQVKYDVLILDYLDIMQPPLEIRDIGLVRIGQSQLIAGLRDIAEQYNVSVITATQGNRLSANKRIVSKEMVAEDYGKIRIADNVISIGENESDKLSSDKIFGIVKARNSQKDLYFRYGVDYNRMRFTYKQQEITVSDTSRRGYDT